MYTPKHFALDDAGTRALLASAETAELVTAHPTGPVATLLPLTHRPDPDGVGFGSLIFHVTRVNPVWRDVGLGDALAILAGPHGYIDADWYASNAASPGVPTWNYVTVHAYGRLVVHDEPAWVRAAVEEMSERFDYDAGRVEAGAFERMLRAIVGLELPISRIEAKAKLNQNRTPADIEGAVAGLRTVGGAELAAQMEEISLPHARARETLVADVRARRGDPGCPS